jgi:hypothetical protein
VARNRCVGRTGCHRSRLGDVACGLGNATVVIGHRIGVRPYTMVKGTGAGVSRCAARSTYRDHGIATMARNRCRLGRSGHYRRGLGDLTSGLGSATIVIGHCVGIGAHAMAKGTSASVSRCPARSAYRDYRVPTVTRNRRRLGRTGHYRRRLCDLTSGLGSATVVVGHCVGIGAHAMAKGASASVSRCPARSAYCDYRVATMARNRCRLGRTGHYRSGLGDLTSGLSSATVVVGHRVGVRAHAMAKGAGACVSRRPARSAYCDYRVATMARNRRRLRRSGHYCSGLGDIASGLGSATVVIGHRVGVRAHAMVKGASACVSRRPATGAYRDYRVATMTRNRCRLGRTGYYRRRLSDLTSGLSSATVVIGHRVGVRAHAMVKGTGASVSRRPATGAYRDYRVATMTRNRCRLGRTGYYRRRLSDLTSGLSSATVVIGHRVGVRAHAMVKGTGASVSRRPATGAYRDYRVATMARNRCRLGRSGHYRRRLSDLARRGRGATVVIGHRVRVRARMNAKRTGPSVIRSGPATGAHCHSGHPAVTRNRCVGRARCQRTWLGDVSRRGRGAPVMIGHRIGVRACMNAKRTGPSVIRSGPATGAHCHSGHPAVTRNRCVGRARCQRTWLGDVSRRGRGAPVMIGHRIGVRACMNAKRTGPSVIRSGPATGAHCHSGHPAVTRNRCVGRARCQRTWLGDVSRRGRCAPVVIGHGIGVGPRMNAKRTGPSVIRSRPAAGAHCHSGHSTITCNRRVGGTRCQRSRLSDVSRRGRCAAPGVGHRVGVCACRAGKRPRAIVRLGAATGAHCHRRHSTVTRNRRVRRTGCDRACRSGSRC